MLKLLFIPTGNVFTLPDIDAFEIKKSDRAGNYKILDAGYQEEKQEFVEPKTVQELVLQTEQKANEIEINDKIEQEKENKPKDVEPKSTLDYRNMKNKDLITLCHRAGLPAHRNESKATLLKRLEGKGFKS